MKKTTLLLLLALLATGLQAQAPDSAEAIVGRYLKLLNYEGLPKDSTLMLETTVTFHGSADTFTVKRWYAVPSMMRVEVWKGKKLSEGLCTNGSTRHREYSSRNGWWNDINHERFHEKLNAYDFRGQLFMWQMRGVKLSYRGTATAKGQQLYVVRAEQENNYPRLYFFEQESGLLVLMKEVDENNDDAVSSTSQQVLRQLKIKPIDYKFYHEYLPVHQSLVPSQESFMREGLLTLMNTTARLVPRDNLLFNKD